MAAGRVAVLVLGAALAGHCLAQVAPPGRVERERASPERPCDKPVYPGEALQYELEGNTVIVFAIGEDGYVVEPSVKRTSGWAMLDAAAMQSLQACRFGTGSNGARMPVEYTWGTETTYVRASLVPRSCAPSARFARFEALNKRASGPDGVLVRLLLRPDGQAYGVRTEGGDLSVAQRDAVAEYVQTCRFAYDPGQPGQRGEGLYGRVVFQ